MTVPWGASRCRTGPLRGRGPDASTRWRSTGSRRGLASSLTWPGGWGWIWDNPAERAHRIVYVRGLTCRAQTGGFGCQVSCGDPRAPPSVRAVAQGLLLVLLGIRTACIEGHATTGGLGWPSRVARVAGHRSPRWSRSESKPPMRRYRHRVADPSFPVMTHLPTGDATAPGDGAGAWTGVARHRRRPDREHRREGRPRPSDEQCGGAARRPDPGCRRSSSCNRPWHGRRGRGGVVGLLTDRVATVQIVAQAPDRCPVSLTFPRSSLPRCGRRGDGSCSG